MSPTLDSGERQGQDTLLDLGTQTDSTTLAGGESGRGPLVDVRVRWRAGQVMLGLAGVFAFVAVARPLESAWPPWARLLVILGLGLGVLASALLASLRGRGQAEPLALYAFLVLCLDGFGQLLAPMGWPVWPLMVLLVSAVAVAEKLGVALGVAALASLMAVAEAAHAGFAPWRTAVAATLGQAALAFTINRALAGEKRRLSKTVDELARIKYGIGQLDDAPQSTRSVDAPVTLRQVSEEGRRARQADRAIDLTEALGKLVGLARRAVNAHAVLHFEVDRGRDVAFVSAADGPSSLVRDCVVPLDERPLCIRRGAPRSLLCHGLQASPLGAPVLRRRGEDRHAPGPPRPSR